MSFINEYFFCDKVRPELMDQLWAKGWRHFGSYFFRYEKLVTRKNNFTVTPLRIDLAKFSYSNSHKRILKKNADLQVVMRDAFIDEEKENLFLIHRVRFKDNIPDSIYTFLSHDPAKIPCNTQEICLFENGKLLAASFLDVGSSSTSSIYSIFDPAEYKRSLGIYLILLSIDYSLKTNRKYYYPGYAYKEPSHYDYKKKFTALEYYQWETAWAPLEPELKPESNLGPTYSD